MNHASSEESVSDINDIICSFLALYPIPQKVFGGVQTKEGRYALFCNVLGVLKEYGFCFLQGGDMRFLPLWLKCTSHECVWGLAVDTDVFFFAFGGKIILILLLLDISVGLAIMYIE